MKIAEIFYSLQGEGSLVGVPSVFVRTSGCNLRCAWCDTPYTSWEPEGEEFALERIVEEVGRYPARHVVVTGGEPMVAPQIVELTQRFHQHGMHITIETAGTVFTPVACKLMSISPKLSNSTPEGRFQTQHERLRMQPGVLRALMERYEYQLKFVIAATEDVVEAAALIAAIGADPGRVLLMPEGTTAAILRERSLWLAEECKRRAYRFSPRLHVDLWGSGRGV